MRNQKNVKQEHSNSADLRQSASGSAVHIRTADPHDFQNLVQSTHTGSNYTRSLCTLNLCNVLAEIHTSSQLHTTLIVKLLITAH